MLRDKGAIGAVARQMSFGNFALEARIASRDPRINHRDYGVNPLFNDLYERFPVVEAIGIAEAPEAPCAIGDSVESQRCTCLVSNEGDEGICGVSHIPSTWSRTG